MHFLDERDSHVLFCFYQFDTGPPTRNGASIFPVPPTITVEATFPSGREGAAYVGGDRFHTNAPIRCSRNN